MKNRFWKVEGVDSDALTYSQAKKMALDITSQTGKPVDIYQYRKDRLGIFQLFKIVEILPELA